MPHSSRSRSHSARPKERRALSSSGSHGRSWALRSPRGRIALQTAVGFPLELTETVAAALGSTGVDVERITWFDAPAETVPDAAPVVILAHHVIQPRRVAALMARDIPHVPVVFSGSSAEVGPFVVPGRTACLACVAAHRRDADPAWPHLAAQLLGRRPPEVSDALAVDAALVAARLISETDRNPDASRCHSLTLRADSLRRSRHAHLPHAECRCRSLAETSTAADPVHPSPTTASAFALPA